VPFFRTGHAFPTQHRAYGAARIFSLPPVIETENGLRSADYLANDDGTGIEASLEQYGLSQWGFVVVRCTYSSQEKWDKFMGLVKEHARDYFIPSFWMEDIHDSLVWTVIEDAETLDGADIVETSRTFEAWVGSQGKQEMEGSVFTTTRHYWPRYTYFMHVDDESLESVVDEAKAREDGGYFCKVVRAEMVLLREQDRAAGTYHEPEGLEAWEADYEERDFRKRVKIDKLVQLYCHLLEIDAWYHMLVDKGIVQDL